MNQLLSTITVSETIGELKAPISGIAFDSRMVEPDNVFVAVRGSQSDGHQFIETAIEKGAQAIVCETLPEHPQQGIAWLKVADSADALGVLASQYYGNPSSQLKLVGVTGTNGKTSTVTLLYQLFSALGYKAGLLSTVENRIVGETISTTMTTPDPLTTNALLAEMVEAGCEYAFMEVSSHAVDQRRIAGLQFTGGVFTNLTHDHLDYHRTFKAYLEAKKRFFDELPATAFALTNLDDRNGGIMVQNSKAKVHRYSLRTLTDFKAKVIENSLTGLNMNLNGHLFFSGLIGEFNAYNLLVVYATAMLLGAEEMEILTHLSRLKTAEGRFDYVFDSQRSIMGIIDYAHTPDALEKVLRTIDKLRRGNVKLITVVGCGGDRDKAKRPVMARSACNHSDQVIITSDNPRSEVPEAIIADMEQGVPEEAQDKVLSITDRRQAIRTACKLAAKGDIILVAGKGHEKYQEIQGVRHPFDDKQVLKEALGIE
ncbi:MAG: UDP-N-acetylmuramoyl-L-alanyl-D-glutamate--2,6-diaminopimelate ligase [Bacteroidota bacterium]